MAISARYSPPDGFIGTKGLASSNSLGSSFWARAKQEGLWPAVNRYLFQRSLCYCDIRKTPYTS